MSVTQLQPDFEPTFEVETYTPKRAQEILDTFNGANRPLLRSRVAQYAYDMEHGRWEQQNGETFQFDRNGNLLNGQHRLHAIIKSGVTMKFLTVRGLDPEVFTKIDRGKARTGKDLVSIEYGVSGTIATMVATAVNLAVTYEIDGAIPGARSKADGINRMETSGNDYLIAYVRKHPELIEAAKYIDEYYSNTAPLSRGVLTWVAYETRRIDIEQSQQFIQALLHGKDLVPSDPVFGLRSVLRTNETATRKADRACVLAGCVKTWNRVRRKTNVVLHSQILRRDFSEFPRFI